MGDYAYRRRHAGIEILHKPTSRVRMVAHEHGEGDDPLPTAQLERAFLSAPVLRSRSKAAADAVFNRDPMVAPVVREQGPARRHVPVGMAESHGLPDFPHILSPRERKHSSGVASCGLGEVHLPFDVESRPLMECREDIDAMLAMMPPPGHYNARPEGAV